MSSPEILAPAGDKDSFLAAVSAGADAIYCGLKHLNARMEANNFTLKELASLVDIAKEKNIKVYLTLNSIVRDKEIPELIDTLLILKKEIPIDGIIFQDLSILKILDKISFSVDLHLSTLSNFSIASSFSSIKKLGIKRVVLPRELSIDEIKYLHERASGVELEVFVHGALCYSVSGRCYWSSLLGGKSALRGRCVQPCRRIYTIDNKTGRFFSCLDLGLDVLVKLLLPLKMVKGWKIEGRKKGPHYIYYTTKAYKILRDNYKDSKAKKMALELLKLSLGRETTHFYFLSHRPFCPVDPSKHTGSGLFVGNTGSDKKGNFFIRPKIPLLPRDILRVGYQDLEVHFIKKISQFVPKGKKFYFDKSEAKGLRKGVPVFLIDRREEELRRELLRLNSQLKEKNIDLYPKNENKKGLVNFKKSKNKVQKCISLHIFKELDKRNFNFSFTKSGVWVELDSDENLLKKFSWYWLPPVIWPEEEKKWIDKIKRILSKGGKNFILNSLWHISLFEDEDIEKLNLWAGPYCNITNPLESEIVKELGFKGLIPSFELSKEDYLEFPKKSIIDVGIVIYGTFPFSISRILFDKTMLKKTIISPKGEPFWIEKINSNYYLYPGWRYDIRKKQKELKKIGYSLFIYLHKKVPKGVKKIDREFEFNWDISEIL